jgi:hypothetical protein
MLQGISAQLIEFNIGEAIQHSLIAEGVCRNRSSSGPRRMEKIVNPHVLVIIMPT